MTTDAERILFRDIAHPCAVTASGDVASVAGIENLRLAIVRRLTAMPGSVVHRQAYGAGLPEFLNRQGTPANQQAMINRVKIHLARERRIDEIVGVAITSWDDSQIDLSVRVRALGGIQTIPVTIGGA